MIRLFCGYDAREAVGFHAFVQSVVETASVPVSVIPVGGGSADRDGTNAFTYSRFLVPHYCGYQGFAIWVDGADMLAAGDIAELWEMRSGWHPVQVVKHDYRTRHARKYVGTELESPNEDYPRKNWSSVILWNCGHYMNKCLTPSYVNEHDGSHLHRFEWIRHHVSKEATKEKADDRIGELPIEWNWLADEYGVNTAAKLLHWTAGVPGFYAYKDAPHSEEWRGAVRRMQRGLA